ncbi:uncharacterized protein LOC128654289 [Bombina bombina]|uniref:uncharacterized protein LOC128654289 n=1 Tax=Bombina bombina TaxID=8345 RepID=UPI00235ADFEA|nr:uncharacterized protein LOC128654289 [Bombina bombina]
MESERGKEFSISVNKGSLLGNNNRLLRNEDFSDRGQKNKTSRLLSDTPFRSSSFHSSVHGSDRVDAKTITTVHAQSVEWGLYRLVSEDTSKSEDQRLTPLVAVPGQPVTRDDIPQTRVGHCHDRRQSDGLGRGLGIPESSGSLVSGRISSTDKYSGTESDIQCSQGLASASEGHVHTVSIRQHDNCCVHQPSGGNKEFPGDGRSDQNHSMGGV